MIFQNSKKNFLGIEHSKKDNYQAIIVPYPLENSVSYGTGTKKGPSEIILASHQLELYDEDLKYEPIKKLYQQFKTYIAEGNRMLINIPFPEIDRRIKGAQTELDQSKNFKHQISNISLDIATKNLLNIMFRENHG